MKLSILLKKLAVPVMALAMVGMLAACSSPSSSGSGSSGSNTNNGGASGNGSGGNGGNGSEGDLSDMFSAPTGDYFVKCDDVILVQCEQNEFSKLSEEYKFTDADGSLSSGGKVFTLNDGGLDKFISVVAEDKYNKVENPVAVVIYKNYPMFALDKDKSDKFSNVLTNNTDYNVYKNGKIIVLTDAGLLKMMTME